MEYRDMEDLMLGMHMVALYNVHEHEWQSWGDAGRRYYGGYKYDCFYNVFKNYKYYEERFDRKP